MLSGPTAKGEVEEKGLQTAILIRYCVRNVLPGHREVCRNLEEKTVVCTGEVGTILGGFRGEAFLDLGDEESFYRWRTTQVQGPV
jgi:hypothetical protein